VPLAALRRSPIEQRKAKLAKLVRGPHLGILLNEYYEGDGEIVFKHACKLGCEGIVSKRLRRNQEWSRHLIATCCPKQMKR
jgi:ATP-dependent DNA ligase